MADEPDDDLEALERAALDLHAAGQFGDAIAAYRTAIAARRAQLATLKFNLGTAFAASDRLEDAAAAYEGALKIRPGWALALDNLGAIRQLQGRPALAERAFRDAIASEPHEGALHFHLGLALSLQGRAGEAIAAHQAAVARAPDHAGAHVQLARLLRDGEPSAALAAATRAAALAPDDAGVHGLHGAALARSGRPAEAAAAYARARDLAPERVEVHYNCALGAEALGDLAGAVAAYRDALARDPVHRPSLVNLSRVLVDLQRIDELRPVYEQLLAVDPGNTMVPHLLDGLRGRTTARAPRAYVVDLFDGIAPHFEALLVDRLGYRAPELLRAAAVRAGVRGRALDLGCGTGLAGAALRPHVDVLHGVDLAPRMIDAARAKGVYDALHLADVVDFLDAQIDGDIPDDLVAEHYDLIVAADVLIYLGDLAPLVAAARRRLAPGGLLLVTTEETDAADVVLLPTGRYAHRRDYLARLAADHGLAVEAVEAFALRTEASGTIAGALWVLRAQNEPA